MNRPRLLSLLILLPLWLLAGAASAQNPTNGQNLYNNYCQGCHGPAQNNKDRVLNGKTSSGIINAIQTVGDMSLFQPVGTLITFEDIDDIASYIATKAPGGSPSFAVAPASHNYGSGAVGVQGAAMTFTVSNSGNVSGTVTSITNNNAAEFVVTGGSCTATPKTVANGANCTLNVAFKPSATGARSATVAIYNSGPISPLVVALSGTGGGAPPPAGQLSVPGSLGFGIQTVNVQSGSSPLTITNVGGSAVTISSVTNSNPGEFPIVANGCAGTVAAGANCTVSVAFKPAAAGARSGALTVNSNGTGSPQAVALSGTGQAGATPGQLSVPGSVNFGTQNVGTPASQSVALTNIGGAAVTFSSVASNNPSEFALSGNSCVGSLGAGSSCGFTVTFTPAVAGARGATITVNSTGTGSPQSIAASGTGTSGPPVTSALAVEFYNASLDHYFLTHIANEIALLDAGVTIRGWARTGQSFNVLPTGQAGSSPVCRYYIPPDKGNSHFYGRGTSECDSTGSKNPTFINEDPQFFHMLLPTLGVCPGGTRNVYRTFSNRADANHRYMVDSAIRDLMVSKSWTAEGDGPNLVVMCSPL